MAQPIYKVWMAKYTQAWYQLSKQEQQDYQKKNAEAMKQVGGETLMFKSCVWSTDEWMAWGVDKYPSLEAAQQYHMLLLNMDHFRYIESRSYLGIDMPPM
jgi:hypothetical protein